MFRGDWVRGGFWLICSWFGALTRCAAFDEGFGVFFYFRPPEVSFDGLFSPKESGVSCGCGIVKEGDHPPSKSVVFQDNQLVMVVPVLAIMGKGVGGGHGGELGVGVVLGFHDSCCSQVEGGHQYKYGAGEGGFEGEFH